MEKERRLFFDIFWEFASGDPQQRLQAATQLLCYLMKKQQQHVEQQQQREQQQETRDESCGQAREARGQQEAQNRTFAAEEGKAGRTKTTQEEVEDVADGRDEGEHRKFQDGKDGEKRKKKKRQTTGAALAAEAAAAEEAGEGKQVTRCEEREEACSGKEKRRKEKKQQVKEGRQQQEDREAGDTHACPATQAAQQQLRQQQEQQQREESEEKTNDEAEEKEREKDSRRRKKRKQQKQQQQQGDEQEEEEEERRQEEQQQQQQQKQRHPPHPQQQIFYGSGRTFSFSLGTSPRLCSPALEYAACRLFSGLASPRGCVRQGYASALLLLLQHFPTEISKAKLLKATQQVFSIKGRAVSFAEIKDLLLGQLFALAVLQKTEFFRSPQGVKEGAAAAVQLLLNAFDEKIYLQEAAVFLLRLILADISAAESPVVALRLVSPRLQALRRYLETKGLSAAAAASWPPHTSSHSSSSHSSSRGEEEKRDDNALLGKTAVGGLPCSLAALQLHLRGDLLRSGWLRAADAEEESDLETGRDVQQQLQQQRPSADGTVVGPEDGSSRAGGETSRRLTSTEAAEIQQLLSPDLLSPRYRPLLLRLLKDSVAFHPLLHSIWTACLQLLTNARLHARPTRAFLAWWEAVDEQLFAGSGGRLPGAAGVAADDADDEPEPGREREGEKTRAAAATSVGQPAAAGRRGEQQSLLLCGEDDLQTNKKGTKNKRGTCTLQQEFLGLRVALEVLLHLKLHALQQEPQQQATSAAEHTAKRRKKKKKNLPLLQGDDEDAVTGVAAASAEKKRKKSTTALRCCFEERAGAAAAATAAATEKTKRQETEEAEGDSPAGREGNKKKGKSVLLAKVRAISKDEALELFGALWTHGRGFTRCLWRHLQAGKGSPLQPVVHAFVRQVGRVLGPVGAACGDERARFSCGSSHVSPSVSHPASSSSFSSSSSSPLFASASMPSSKREGCHAARREAAPAGAGGLPLPCGARLLPAMEDSREKKEAELFDSLLQPFARDDEVLNCCSFSSSRGNKRGSAELLREAPLFLPFFCRREILLAFARAANFTPLKRSFSTMLVRLWFSDVLAGGDIAAPAALLLTFLPPAAASSSSSSASLAKPTAFAVPPASKRSAAREGKLATPWLLEFLFNVLQQAATAPVPSRPLCYPAFEACGEFPSSSSSSAVALPGRLPRVCPSTQQRLASSSPSFSLFTSVLLSVVLSANLNFRLEEGQEEEEEEQQQQRGVSLPPVQQPRRPRAATLLPATFLTSPVTLASSAVAALGEKAGDDGSAKEGMGHRWRQLRDPQAQGQEQQLLVGDPFVRLPQRKSLLRCEWAKQKREDVEATAQTLPPTPLFLLTEKQQLGGQCAAKMCETLLLHFSRETAEIMKRWSRVCLSSGVAPAAADPAQDGAERGGPFAEKQETQGDNSPVSVREKTQKMRKRKAVGEASDTADENDGGEAAATANSAGRTVSSAASVEETARAAETCRAGKGTGNVVAHVVGAAACRRSKGGDFEELCQIATENFFVRSLVAAHFLFFRTLQAATAATACAAAGHREAPCRNGGVRAESLQQQRKRKAVLRNRGLDDGRDARRYRSFCFSAVIPSAEEERRCVSAAGGLSVYNTLQQQQQKSCCGRSAETGLVSLQAEVTKRTQLLERLTATQLRCLRVEPGKKLNCRSSKEEDDGEDEAEKRHERSDSSTHRQQARAKREFISNSGDAGDGQRDEADDSPREEEEEEDKVGGILCLSFEAAAVAQELLCNVDEVTRPQWRDAGKEQMKRRRNENCVPAFSVAATAGVVPQVQEKQQLLNAPPRGDETQSSGGYESKKSRRAKSAHAESRQKEPKEVEMEDGETAAGAAEKTEAEERAAGDRRGRAGQGTQRRAGREGSSGITLVELAGAAAAAQILAAALATLGLYSYLVATDMNVLAEGKRDEARERAASAEEVELDAVDEEESSEEKTEEEDEEEGKEKRCWSHGSARQKRQKGKGSDRCMRLPREGRVGFAGTDAAEEEDSHANVRRAAGDVDAAHTAPAVERAATAGRRGGSAVGAVGRQEAESSDGEDLEVNADEEELTTFCVVLAQLVDQGKGAAELLRRCRYVDYMQTKMWREGDTAGAVVEQKQPDLSVTADDGCARKGAASWREGVSRDRKKRAGKNQRSVGEIDEDVTRLASEREAGRRTGQKEVAGTDTGSLAREADLFKDIFSETAASAVRLLFVEGDGFGGGLLRGVGRSLWKVFCCFAKCDTLGVLLDLAAARPTPAASRLAALRLLQPWRAEGSCSSSSGSTCSSSSSDEDEEEADEREEEEQEEGSDSDSSSSGRCSDSVGEGETSLGRKGDETTETAAAEGVSKKERQRREVREKEANTWLAVCDGLNGKGATREELRNLKKKRINLRNGQEAELQVVKTQHEHRVDATGATAGDARQPKKQQQQQRHQDGEDTLRRGRNKEKQKEEQAQEVDDRLSVELDLECTYRALLDEDGDVLPDAYNVPLKKNLGPRVSQRQQLRKEKQRQMELRLRAAALLQTYICTSPRFSSSLHLLASLCFIYVRTAGRVNFQADALLAARWKQFAEKINRIILDVCAHAAAVLKKSKGAPTVAALAAAAAASAAAAAGDAPSAKRTTTRDAAAGAATETGAARPAKADQPHCNSGEVTPGVQTAARKQQGAQQQALVDLFVKTGDSNVVAFWCALLAWRRQFCARENQQDRRPSRDGAGVSTAEAAVDTDGPGLEVTTCKLSIRKQPSTLCNRKARISSGAATHTAAPLAALPPLIVNTSPSECVRGLGRISSKVRIAGYGVEESLQSEGEYRSASTGTRIEKNLSKRGSNRCHVGRSSHVSSSGDCRPSAATKTNRMNREEAVELGEECRVEDKSESSLHGEDREMVSCLRECWCTAELCLARRAVEVMEICRRSRQLQQKAAASSCQQACLAVLLHMFRVELQVAAFYQLPGAVLSAGATTAYSGGVAWSCQRCQKPHFEQVDVNRQKPEPSQEKDRRTELMQLEAGTGGEQQVLTWPGSAATQLLSAGLVGWAQKARSSKQQHLDGLFFRCVADKRAELLRFVDIVGAAVLTNRLFVKRECLALAATVVKKHGLCGISPGSLEASCNCCSALQEGGKIDEKLPDSWLDAGGDGNTNAAVRGLILGGTRRKKDCQDGPAAVTRRKSAFYPNVVLDVPFLPWGRSGEESWKTDERQREQQSQQKEDDARDVRAAACVTPLNERLSGNGENTPKWREVNVEEKLTKKSPNDGSACNERRVEAAFYAERGNLVDIGEDVSQRWLATKQETAKEGRSGREGHNNCGVGFCVENREVVLQRTLQRLTQMLMLTLEADSTAHDEHAHRAAISAGQRKALQKELLNTFSVVVQAVISRPLYPRKFQQQQQQGSGQSRNRDGETGQGEGQRNEVTTQKHQASSAATAAVSTALVPTVQAAYAAVALLQRSSAARQIKDAAGRVLQLFEELAVGRFGR